ncbi:CLI_3235 family bacteriocin precursor [Clostridium cibarium]|uniref:CLI_3235 family bacteriocin n=1 Tax=Clostridium cibarium TaxID=2762247 RepID=A0ABR8PXB1_9CLOT|nr:CLI_3235 family bacteriocin precursor [Clostridium cibarium]MBD7912796.1 CLI_3235 family bacteriocin precursor [Clostridium cibarium]
MKKLLKNNVNESNTIQAYIGQCSCRCYCGCQAWYHPSSASHATKEALSYAETYLEI